MKKIAIALSVAALIAGSVSNSPAAVNPDFSNPTQGIDITENALMLRPPALRGGVGIPPDATWTLCNSIYDDACTKANLINVWNHLPPCSSQISVNCISSVYAVDEAGKKSEGKFVKYATPDTKYDYPASEVNNLPQGKSQGGIWQIPGITHAGGNDLYFASTYLSGGLEKSPGIKVISENFNFNYLESAISPVKEVYGNYPQAIPLDSSLPCEDTSQPCKNNGFGVSVPGPITADRNSCVMMGGGICYSTPDFPKDYRFGMKIVLGNRMKGWFHGRIFQPSINVQASGSGQIITFEALPVQVPTLYERVNSSEIGPDFRAYLTSGRSFAVGGGFFMPGNSGQDAIEMAGYWLPLVKDKATTSRTYWNVRTLESYQGGDISRCSDRDGNLAGIVTTNSLVYSAGPPTYNRAEGSLDYKVLSPHLTATGEVAIGSYDLVLRSDVARCIYGFSKAPIQAVVSIINSDGENKVATTLIREKDGWLSLSAKGFTFSSPTIRIVLSQEADVEPVVAPGVPTKKIAKKTIITCVKGKVSKKVSGIKPRCPSGFKKR